MNANDSSEETLSPPPAAPIPDRLRCLQCNEPVPNAVCGRKSPCPSCGFPYPLGDCSDLAEN